MKRTPFGMPMLALFMSLVFMEALLWTVAFVNPRIAGLLSPGVPMFISDPVLRKRPNPELPDHDTRGYRNPVALERATVVVLGDSQTYGVHTTRANAWPMLLGDALEVPAYSISFSGWGPVHYDVVLHEVFELEPKVIVIAIYSGNDFAEAYSMAMRADSQSLGIEVSNDRALFDRSTAERGSLFAPWNESRALRRGTVIPWLESWTKPLEAHLKVLGLVRGLSRIVTGRAAGVKTDSNRNDYERYARQVAGLPAEYFHPFRTGTVATIFTPLTRFVLVDRADPRIEEGVRITLAVIQRFETHCGQDCTVVVLTIPTKELVFEESVRRSGNEAPASYQALVIAESALWQDFAESLRGRGTIVIDAGLPLRRAISEGVNPYPSDWDGHPNVLGNRVVSDHVAAHPVFDDVRP